jgi:hypothetical protein
MTETRLENPPHEKFQKWRVAQPRGFVVNAGKTLHLASCKHFGAPTRPRVVGKWDLGKTRKVCDLSKEAATRGLSVKSCADCSP